MIKMKAVIFDMDGVILDSEPLHWQAGRNIMKMFGLDLKFEEFQNFLGKTDKSAWTELNARYKMADSVDKLLNMKRAEYMKILRSTELKPTTYLPEFLGSIRKAGLKIGLASSSRMEEIEYIIQTLGIKHYFEAIVSGEFIEKSKPAPDIYIEAAKKVKARPEECIAIEDSHNGARSAKSAGMKVVGFYSAFNKVDLSHADIIIDSFRTDIGKIIEKIKGDKK